MSNKKSKLIIFIILLILTNLIFIPWLKGHMATDSYNIWNLGYKEWTKTNSLIDGRFFTAITTLIMNYFNVPIGAYIVIMLELAIIISCVCVLILIETIKKFKEPKSIYSEILLIIACYYTIFNFMYIENLYFLESGIMALSILFYILSARMLVQKNRFWSIKSFVFMLIALMCYQGTISMFFLTVLVFTMCKETKSKTIIKNFFQAIIIAMIGIFINQLEIKLIEHIYQIKQNRDINFSIIVNNILFILENYWIVLKNVGYYLPKYTYVIMLCVAEMLFIFKFAIQNKQKQDSKNVAGALQTLSIIIIGIGAGFIVSIMNTSGFWFGRIRYSIGALIGFLWIFIWVKTDFAQNKSIYNIILAVCLIAYGIINSANYVCVMLEHNKVNNLDRETTLNLNEHVITYEEEEKIKVTKIAVVVEYENTSMAFYPKTKYVGSIIMPSAIKTRWSAAGCYNYYSNSKLETYEPTKEEKNVFLSNKKFYQCINDTLYISAYMY